MRRARLFGDRQRWMVAFVLALLVFSESPLVVDVPFFDEWWAVPGGVMVAGPAILAPRWPIRSSFAAVGVLVCWSVVVHLAGARLAGSMSLAETVAVAIIIVAVARVTPARTAAALVGLLIAGHTAAAVIRDWRSDAIAALGWEWIVATMFWFGPAVVIGLYLRGRDTLTTRATDAAVEAARRRERVDLARELHDVVAHHIGGIVVQAQAAQVVAGTGAEAEAPVLPLIERAGIDALSAMRRMVSVLRDGDPDGDVPTRTTDLIADLHAVTATLPGRTPVRLTVEMADQIPAEVGTSVLRLVQESVTNAHRHATGAHEIAVIVRAEGGIVQVTVRDDGRPDRETKKYGGGFGLVGMRERVLLLGGRFSAGRGPGGGWQVVADVPLAGVRL